MAGKIQSWGLRRFEGSARSTSRNGLPCMASLSVFCRTQFSACSLFRQAPLSIKFGTPLQLERWLMVGISKMKD